MLSKHFSWFSLEEWTTPRILLAYAISTAALSAINDGNDELEYVFYVCKLLQ